MTTTTNLIERLRCFEHPNAEGEELMLQASDLLEAQAKQIEALQADAERYQVLRDDKYQRHEDDICVSDSSFNTYFGAELDTEVDTLKARYEALEDAAKGNV